MPYPTCAQRINDEWKRERSKILWGIGAADFIDGNDGFDYFGYDTEDENTPERRREIYKEMALFFGIDEEGALDVLIGCWPYSQGEFNQETEKRLAFHIQLSWGGPSDGIIVFCRERPSWWEVEKTIYYYKDWFDEAYYSLNSSELTFVECLIRDSLPKTRVEG